MITTFERRYIGPKDHERAKRIATEFVIKDAKYHHGDAVNFTISDIQPTSSMPYWGVRLEVMQ